MKRLRIAIIIVTASLVGAVAAGCGGGGAAPAALSGPAPSATPSALPTKATFPTLLPTATLMPLLKLTPTEAPPSPTPAPTTQATAPAVAVAPTATPTAAATGSPAPAPAAGGPTLTIGGTTANVRAGPGTNYAVIGQAVAGQKYAVTGRVAAGDWWQIVLDGKAGWLAASVAGRPSSSEQIPLITQLPPTPVPAAPAPGGAPAGTTVPAPISQPVAAGAGKIAFSSGKGGSSDVALLDVASGKVSVLIEDGRQPDIRYDGSLIAFKGTGGRATELHTIRNDRNGLTQVGSRADDQYPSWAPGRNMALTFFTTGFDPALLCMQKDPNGPQGDTIMRTQYIPVPAGTERPVQGRYPTWIGPARVAFTGCDSWLQASNCGLWSMDTGKWRDFTPYFLVDDQGARTSDAAGETLLYASPAGGNWDVYAIRWTPPARKIDPKAVPVQLTRDGAQDLGATFSPDGRSIAFMSNRGGGWGIWVMNADGSNQRLLAAVPQGFGPRPEEERLSWGP